MLIGETPGVTDSAVDVEKAKREESGAEALRSRRPGVPPLSPQPLLRLLGLG